MTEQLDITHVMAFSEIPGRPVFAGAENHLFTLMTGQLAAGCRVHLVMLVVKNGPNLERRAAELRSHGIDVRIVRHQLPLRRWLGPFARLAALPALRNRLRENGSDVIHTHLPQASQLGRLAAVWGPWAVVDSVHNDEPEFARISWRLRLRLLDRITDGYIAISQAVRNALVRYGHINPDRIAVVPYGIGIAAPVATKEEARRLLGINQDRFVVGFVGRLTAQKNLTLLLQAMSRLPDIDCVIVGGGEEENALRAYATEVGATNVTFLGPVADATSIMPAFDVLCLPSRWEGLGLVLLEAMAQSIPVIGSDAGAIPEVLDGGSTGLLFRSGVVRELVTAIRCVRDDPLSARARAARALRRAQEVYTVAAMIDATNSVYRLSLERRRCRRASRS